MPAADPLPHPETLQPQRHRWTDDAAQLVRGCCMGAADVVPGVSGGTVALVLGIYPRLITALSRLDYRLVKLLRSGQWSAAADYLDLRFLATLASGLLLGLGITLVTVAQLLYQPQTRPLVMAAFFGLIAGSIWIVARMLRPWNLQVLTWAVPGLVLALFLGLATPAEMAVNPPLFYVFTCGVVAISAMILPGISGAAILVLLGLYGFLVHAPLEILRGHDVSRNATSLLVFGAGCAAGLMLLSRLLRWWLARYPQPTLAFLAGLMAGSLLRLWPVQRDLTPERTDFKSKLFEPVWAWPWEPTVLPLWLLAAGCTALVVAVDWWGQRVSGSRLGPMSALPPG